MNDGVRYNIVSIQGTRISLFNTRLGPEKRKKRYILYMYYIFYMSYILYISYMLIIYIYIYIYIAYICRVKSEWYINRTSFTTYIG